MGTQDALENMQLSPTSSLYGSYVPQAPKKPEPPPPPVKKVRKAPPPPPKVKPYIPPPKAADQVKDFLIFVLFVVVIVCLPAILIFALSEDTDWKTDFSTL